MYGAVQKSFHFLKLNSKSQDILAGEQGIVQFINLTLTGHFAIFYALTLKFSVTGYQCNYTSFISKPIPVLTCTTCDSLNELLLEVH